MLPIRNISYLLPMCCSFWEKCKNSPKTDLGYSTPLTLSNSLIAIIAQTKRVLINFPTKNAWIWMNSTSKILKMIVKKKSAKVCLFVCLFVLFCFVLFFVFCFNLWSIGRGQNNNFLRPYLGTWPPMWTVCDVFEYPLISLKVVHLYRV